jgi:hypothetical protein
MTDFQVVAHFIKKKIKKLRIMHELYSKITMICDLNFLLPFIEQNYTRFIIAYFSFKEIYDFSTLLISTIGTLRTFNGGKRKDRIYFNFVNERQQTLGLQPEI